MNQKELESSTTGGRHRTKVIREFDFPREAVFDMTIDPRKAAKWFLSPDGGTKLRFEMDPRPGGQITLHDRNDEGRVFRSSGTFVEIVAPERISLRTATTPDGDTVPFEAIHTMTFEALGPKRTRLTVVVEVLATGAFPGGVEALMQGYRGGWGGSLNVLERELQRAPLAR